MKTELLFRDDAYRRECDALLFAFRGDAVVLSATVFYARGGGQPGDSGVLILGDGARVEIADAVYDRSEGGDGAVLHILKNPDDAAKFAWLPTGLEPPTPYLDGDTRILEPARCVIDWERRYRLMRTHTALHLLYAAAKDPATGTAAVTGSAVGELRGRIDFDMPDPPDREALEAEMNRLVAADLEVRTRWTDASEVSANPSLSPGAPPPKEGKIRLVEIAGADIQACGGTHLSRTGEVGKIRAAKIEKKGKRNRRVVIELEE